MLNKTIEQQSEHGGHDSYLYGKHRAELNFLCSCDVCLLDPLSEGLVCVLVHFGQLVFVLVLELLLLLAGLGSLLLGLLGAGRGNGGRAHLGRALLAHPLHLRDKLVVSRSCHETPQTEPLMHSFADPGCLSWIADRNFSNQDPNFFHPGSEFFHPGSASKNIRQHNCI